MEIVKIICAILLPPVAVFLHVGLNNMHFWLNIILTLLGYFPGLIHAFYVLMTQEAIDLNNLVK